MEVANNPDPPCGGAVPAELRGCVPVAAVCNGSLIFGVAASVKELERCVNALGFVANLNPDPSGGFLASAATDKGVYYPLYEKMVELDVPAMVHVSSSCNPCHHHVGAHYLNENLGVHAVAAHAAIV